MPGTAVSGLGRLTLKKPNLLLKLLPPKRKRQGKKLAAIGAKGEANGSSIRVDFSEKGLYSS